MTPGASLCAEVCDPRGLASCHSITQHGRPWPPLSTSCLWRSTKRQRQSRGKTHLTLNTVPVPEVHPWPNQEPPRPLLQAQCFPLVPAASGSQILRSCQGSGGWLLGVGSTAAGPGTAPSAPAWNRGKGVPTLVRPGWPGSSLPCTWPHYSRCGEEHMWARLQLPPALPQTGWPASAPSQPWLLLCHTLAEDQDWRRWSQVMVGSLTH